MIDKILALLIIAIGAVGMAYCILAMSRLPVTPKLNKLKRCIYETDGKTVRNNCQSSVGYNRPTRRWDFSIK